MNYVQYAEKTLKQNSCRITKPRKAVIDVLKDSEKPLNAYEIAEIVRKEGISIDTSTVYRILEVFRDYQLVHFVKEAQGYVGCKNWSCGNAKHCHHQFVCRSCGSVKEVHVDDGDFMKKLQQKLAKMKIEDHYLELSGICENCFVL